MCWNQFTNLAIFSYQCDVTLTLTFDLLTRKSIGHILFMLLIRCVYVKFRVDR